MLFSNYTRNYCTSKQAQAIAIAAVEGGRLVYYSNVVAICNVLRQVFAMMAMIMM